jgi:hypothetical protein
VTAAARDGRLPCVRLPGPDGRPASLRFDPDELEGWIEAARAAWQPGASAAATLRRTGRGV